MVNAFRDAMAKLAVVGQDTSNMIDCSAMIPEPKMHIPENPRGYYSKVEHHRKIPNRRGHGYYSPVENHLR